MTVIYVGLFPFDYLPDNFYEEGCISLKTNVFNSLYPFPTLFLFFVPFVVFCREGLKRFTNRRFGKIYPSSCRSFGSYGWMGEVGL